MSKNAKVLPYFYYRKCPKINVGTLLTTGKMLTFLPILWISGTT